MAVSISGGKRQKSAGKSRLTWILLRCSGCRANALAFTFHEGQVDPHRRHNLPHAIVQFACDTPAFFVLHLQESAGKLTHDFGLFS